MRSRDTRPLPGASESRPPLVAGLLVVLLIGALGFAWLSGERDVTLVVDGEATQTRSHAATVGELLARAGLETGPDDEVDPVPDTALADGMTVEYVRAREVTVLVGDVDERMLVTALSLDEVLADLGMASPRRTGVRAARGSRPASAPTAVADEPREAVALTVVADGTTRDVITDEAHVGELLERLGIEVGSADRVIPGLQHPAEPDIVVTVQRVRTAVETREVPIPHGTQERPTEDLPQGERRVARPGVDGVQEVTEEVVTVDDVEESRTVLAERVAAEPRAEIVEVGTAAPPAPADPPPHSPAASPDAGPEPEPSAGNVQEGGASWYDNPAGGMTAAHRTIPRGTIVTVTNLANGESVQVRINDRGPYVDGRVIDLNREAFAAIATVSEGVAQVRIEW